MSRSGSTTMLSCVKKSAAPCPGKYHCQQVNQGHRQKQFYSGLHLVTAASSAVWNVEEDEDQLNRKVLRKTINQPSFTFSQRGKNSKSNLGREKLFGMKYLPVGLNSCSSPSYFFSFFQTVIRNCMFFCSKGWISWMVVNSSRDRS